MIINSYSIFGENYWGVIPLLLRVHFAVFPHKRYQLRIYHDETLNRSPHKNLLLSLGKLNLIKTIFVNEPVAKCKSMLWRMIPIWDPEVDFVFCKDADSIPIPKERKIMEEFMNSNFSVLGINDNASHSLPLMGGMIGFKTKEFIRNSGISTFGDFMRIGNSANNSWETHGSDQRYMQSYLLPRIRNDMVLYRTFSGANSISNLKCKLHLHNSSLDNINEQILNFGDKCTNYIGACGISGPLNVELYDNFKKLGCSTVFDFFDKYGNEEINLIIREEERKIH